MANTNAPFGFRPGMRTLTGDRGTVPTHKLAGYGTVLFVNDAVTHAAAGASPAGPWTRQSPSARPLSPEDPPIPWLGPRSWGGHENRALGIIMHGGKRSKRPSSPGSHRRVQEWSPQVRHSGNSRLVAIKRVRMKKQYAWR
jgi:hypothetical protein